ncbi:MAG: hypothetical protein AB6733_12060 [Clostridiaceae bacterium]
MKWIRFDKMSETYGIVREINYVPDDPVHGVSPGRSSQGVYVENIPEAAIMEGKDALLIVNPVTLELWYEYIDRPLTSEEELKRIKIENENFKNQLAQTNADMQGLMDYLGQQGLI